MEYTFIYPNQLYENHPAISRDRKIILIEDPLFFGDDKYPVKYHKQKLLLHYMSMRRFSSKKCKDGYDIEIINFSDLKRDNYTNWLIKKFNIHVVHIVDVVDYVLKNRIKKAIIECGASLKWYDSPNFLLTQSDVNNDFSGKKRHLMANFYKKQRRRYDILLEPDGSPVGGAWSFDAQNRKKLPKIIKLPLELKIKYNQDDLSKSRSLVNEYFFENHGSIDGFNYPVDHEQAKKSLEYFLSKKFELFGPYEDAVSKLDSTLFHSVLTPYMNIGLITPIEVIERVNYFAKEHKIPINSYEGFIRQIIGWREFIRGIYIVDGVKQRTENFWKFDRDIPHSFYDGNTGLDPVDRTIEKLMSNAYLHHIERLMVMGNIFFLLRIDPNKVYRWFMELFIDAYDWVMVPNVYGMSQFADGGLMSTKPYISGSNYILKMSDYRKGDWCDTWDALYWNFIDENRDFIRKNPRTSMMINMYDKKSKEMKLTYKKIERNFQL